MDLEKMSLTEIMTEYPDFFEIVEEPAYSLGIIKRFLHKYDFCTLILFISHGIQLAENEHSELLNDWNECKNALEMYMRCDGSFKQLDELGWEEYIQNVADGSPISIGGFLFLYFFLPSFIPKYTCAE